MAMQRRPFCEGSLVGGGIRNCSASSDNTRYIRSPSEAMKGQFYEPGIQKVLKSNDECFDVDRVIKTRKRNRKLVVVSVLHVVCQMI